MVIAFVSDFGIDPDDIAVVEYDGFGEFKADDEGDAVEGIGGTEFICHWASLILQEQGGVF